MLHGVALVDELDGENWVGGVQGDSFLDSTTRAVRYGAVIQQAIFGIHLLRRALTRRMHLDQRSWKQCEREAPVVEGPTETASQAS